MVEKAPPVLVEVTRGPEVECRHRGEIAVVDKEGQLRAGLGDPATLVCMRSLAKPFQALPLITTGAAEAFGFGPELLLALATKSRRPSEATCTAVGYQPVGMSPITCETPALPLPRAFGERRTTASAFSPALLR
jgi:L-asparaginase II